MSVAAMIDHLAFFFSDEQQIARAGVTTRERESERGKSLRIL